MKSLIVSLITLSTLLLAVSAQFPTLSPSYSFQGEITVTGSDIPPFDISVSIDIARRLELIEQNGVLGSTTENQILHSENDNATYISVNGSACNETAFNPRFTFFPLSTNVWDLYAAGTESPLGTYTYTDGFLTNQVTIVHNAPAAFVYSFGAMVIASVIVTSFDNTTPDFSTFSLPSECSQFSCSACYQTAPFPVLSPSYAISGTGLRTESGQSSMFFSYKISIDIDRQLQLIEESDTTSGVTTNIMDISSANDQATYTSVDGVCVENTAYNPALNFPLNTNVWQLYADGLESPAGTYSFTQDGTLHQVVIEDGSPASFGFAFGNTAIVFSVDSFKNVTPDFSTFSLPSGCSEYTCAACYSGAVGVASSVLLVLSALLVYLMTAV